MYDQVAEPGAEGPLGLPRPDQEHRREREQLPEDEERDQVPGVNRPDRAPRVQDGGDVLHTGTVLLLEMERKQVAQERSQVEQVAEEHGQLGVL